MDALKRKKRKLQWLNKGWTVKVAHQASGNAHGGWGFLEY